MTLQERRRALMAVGGGSPIVHGTWADLFRAIDGGTYATEYEVGEILPLDLGTEGIVNAQIVAFNADSKSDNSGYAPVTFITQYVCKTSKTWNPTLSPSTTPYTEGTGNIGGYTKSTIYTYVQNTLKPLFPSDVRNRIVTVKKYSRYFNTAGTAVRNSLSSEDVWIPSAYEMFTVSSYSENTGVQYTSFFNTESKRIKTQNNSSTGQIYWLRSAGNGAGTLGLVSATGTKSNTGNPQTARKIALGFCIG